MRIQVRRCFTLDIRSLALARIFAGIVLLFDLGYRALYLEAHYTEEGILPLSLLNRYFGPPQFPSVHMLADSFAFEATLFALHALLALALALGFGTRWVTIGCWYMTCSLHARNPIVLNGGDFLLHILLFWAIFLPWGDCWSVDARGKDKPYQLFSGATIAWGLQMLMVYFLAAVHKLDSFVWVDEMSAVYYALNQDAYARASAQWLLQFQDLLGPMTAVVLIFELVVGFLLLAPAPWVRLAAVFSCVMLHWGFGLFIELGIFRYCPWIGLFALIPAAFWGLLFGEKEPPEVESLSWKAPQSLIPLLVMAMVLWLQVNLVRGIEGAPLTGVAQTLGVWQKWRMYTGTSLILDGWQVAVAQLSDGSEVDLLNQGQPVSWDKPATVSALYPTQRWRRHWVTAADPVFHVLPPYYARWLVRQWDQAHPDRKVKAIRLVDVAEASKPSEQPSRYEYRELYNTTFE